MTQRELEDKLAQRAACPGPGRQPDRRHDPVRRQSQRAAPLLQPRLLLPRPSRTPSSSSARGPRPRSSSSTRTSAPTASASWPTSRRARRACSSSATPTSGSRWLPTRAACRSRSPTPATAASSRFKPDSGRAFDRHRAGRPTIPLLSGLLRTALTADGFFLEAHPKLRPVDLANEGEYLCGPRALAALHGRDHRPGQGGRGPRRDRAVARVPRDRRPDRQGRSRQAARPAPPA